MTETGAGKTIIHLKRSFPCNIEPLFEAFLDPEKFRNWFSPPGFEVGIVEIEPVEGGKYSCQLLKENKHVLSIKGRYSVIAENKTISFSFLYEPDISSMGESKVTVNFFQRGEETEITLIQEIYRDVSAEGRTKGWEYMFSLLEGILNNN